ncbi:arginase [Dermatophagoides pteronyssinus]|uniref:arginase n=1 Tax=Dermatophagoides pteronyssinus TaxID=6956 RepID=UPI003F66AFF4
MLTTKLSMRSKLSKKSSIEWRQIRQINSNIGVIGIPFWYGQSRLGTNMAPEILRSKGLIDKLSAQFGQNRVVDFGNISLEIDSNEISKNQWKNPNEFNLWKLSEKSSKFIENLIKNDYVPLILGGDHSIAVGSVMGTKQALINMGNSDGDDLSLIWIDAHADANTVQSSLSGNLHGMPMSFLVKPTSTEHQQNQQQQIKPCINAKNIVYIGLRDVEIQELHLLKELNIAYFSMKDVDNLGINEVIARSLDHIDPLGKNHLHISFDVDSLDPMIIPSTGTPVMGGLTFRETLQIGEYINNTGRMIAMDLVEFNPNIGTEQMINQSAKTIIEIIMAFFGKSRLG